MSRPELLDSTILAQPLQIALRAYVPLAKAEPRKKSRPSPGPSDWVLIFDTETTTDAAQRLRFGSFQLRQGGALRKAGLFYDPAALSRREQDVLARYASENGLELMTTADFIEKIFYGYGYELRATIVGFNLPFDLSRLAIRHGSARRRPMRGGFSFQLSENRWRPRVQIKHLSRRASLIRFTAPPRQRTTRGMRKHSRVPVRRGFFVDVKTAGAALTSRSDSLASLAEFLNVPSRKIVTEEHGGPLTAAYVRYAAQDTQVTWECFAELRDRYAEHRLTQTPLDRIKSEAGIGKAYLKQMMVQPWQIVQPDFPPELTNIIMHTYFGGRSEDHLRRVIAQVLYCDFLSMYPTVCTLMGLWRCVIAKGVTTIDTTEETRAFLAAVAMQDLQLPETWRKLTTLVQVLPQGDLLPVRAPYGEAQYTIGLNYLTHDKPVWVTLADCINSKNHTGKAPEIVKALTFDPKGIQTGLRPVDIAGNPEFRVDPRSGDFYKRLIEMRSAIKRRLKSCDPAERDLLKSQEQALKILANSMSYGIFMEMNVEELVKPAEALRFSDDGTAHAISIDKAELPGSYFHPLLASLITAAARLMLGTAEKLGAAAGLDWAFCDTDSMAYAKPDGMDDSEFYSRVEEIRAWFNALNPYDGAGDLLKLEDANFAVVDGRRTDDLLPLYVWAISAKRYALFNIDPSGNPVLRKASAHGLGHLLAPYSDAGAPDFIPEPALPLKDIGVARWQYDLWYRIVDAALNGNPDQPNLSELPEFHKPAASRYAATTPELLRWFDRFNEEREYAAKVRPFNFLTVFPAKRISVPVCEIPKKTPKNRKLPGWVELPRPVAPFSSDPNRATTNCFDRLTGNMISADQLKTYADALEQYHLHPESKFLNGDYADRGATQRRHIAVAGIRYIGKEANRWEEQFYLGFEPEAQAEYDSGPEAIENLRARLCQAAAEFGQRKLAKAAGVSREQIRSIMSGKVAPRKKTVEILLKTMSDLSSHGHYKK